MLKLLGVIIPIAVVDSLNPVTIAVHVYLLTTRKPAVRTATYVLGVFIAYLAGGLFLALGLHAVVDAGKSLVAGNEALGYVGRFIFGVLLLGFGVYFYCKATDHAEVKQPASLHPLRTFLLGFGVTASDLPTALPYFAAIKRTLDTELAMAAVVVALGLYTLVYVLPLLLLLGIYLSHRRESTPLLRGINEWLARWSRPVIALFCLSAGLLLIANAAVYFLKNTCVGGNNTAARFSTPTANARHRETSATTVYVRRNYAEIG